MAALFPSFTFYVGKIHIAIVEFSVTVDKISVFRLVENGDKLQLPIFREIENIIERSQFIIIKIRAFILKLCVF
ncbi:hypothetical protein, partial [Chryseobacterium taklimakanense]|uniref:hypothetical protein n=1 Tax=Chryseobacterium taklimakanense TaxID=536441 RepID=UPI0023F7EB72